MLLCTFSIYQDNEDVWDDSALIEAYDTAVNSFKVSKIYVSKIVIISYLSSCIIHPNHHLRIDHGKTRIKDHPNKTKSNKSQCA